MKCAMTLAVVANGGNGCFASGEKKAKNTFQHAMRSPLTFFTGMFFVGNDDDDHFTFFLDFGDVLKKLGV